MKTKYLILLYLAIITFVANAGDTIFNSAPATRPWNSQYMQRIFRDEFSGTNLNTTIWDIDQCESRGHNGNNEGEPNNIIVSDSTLKLTARYVPGFIDNNCYDGTHQITNFTTAEIWSNRNRYKYGSFEARCFMPRGDHYYYAYWLWGPSDNEYPHDGYTSEIDIAEGCEWNDGSHHNMKSTFHYWPPQGSEIQLSDETTHGYGTIYEGSWHTYKIVWNPYEVIFYIDSIEVWRRSKYYTGSDLKANDVGMLQIQPNVIYHERSWFPNDKMITVFQMHNTTHTPSSDLPATMMVDYVRVKQFFLAPEITLSTAVVCTTGIATMDVATEATNVTWQLSPSNLFTTPSGSGKVATITRASGASGKGKITYTFQMPSGETFTAEKEVLVGPQVPGTISIQMDAPIHRFTATIDPVPTVTTYNWYLNGVLNNTYHGTEAIFNRVSPYCGGSYNIDVKAYNPCGWSALKHMTVIEPSCLYGMVISPNPTTTVSDIEIYSQSEVSIDTDIEWQLEVYDQMQGVKDKQTKIKGCKTKLSTNGWKDGIYFIRAIVGNEKISGTLVVKH